MRTGTFASPRMLVFFRSKLRADRGLHGHAETPKHAAYIQLLPTDRNAILSCPSIEFALGVGDGMAGDLAPGL